MAFPTAVNSQITDAVTQSNVKVVGEAPAIAMGSIYQSLAHSTGILFENAVAAQQQQNIIAQAAANQGVIQIYSLDTTAAAGVTEKVAQTGVSDNLTSLLTVLRAVQPQPAPKAEAVATSPAATDTSAVADGIADQIQTAVRFSNNAVLDNADAFAKGVHGAVDEMAHAIDAMNRVSHANLLRILQEAALSATLAAMLREPQRAKEYEDVLQAIKRLE